MFKKVLLWVRQQKKYLLGILLLLSIIVLLLPLPVSKEYLIGNRWCATYPLHRWRFMEDGEFEQSYILISEFDGVSFSDKGIWRNSGGTVYIDIQSGDFMGARAEFKARSVGLGKFLWSYGEFSLDQKDENVLLLLPCPYN